MYKDRIENTKEDLDKVRSLIKEHLELEQRLLGALITLQDLESEQEAKEAVAATDVSPAK